MTPEQVLKILNRFSTQHPRITLKFGRDSIQRGIYIEIQLRGPDSRQPDQLGETRFQRLLDYRDLEFMSESLLKITLQGFWRAFWAHEGDEWLKFDGVIFEDPHRGEVFLNEKSSLHEGSESRG